MVEFQVCWIIRSAPRLIWLLCFFFQRPSWYIATDALNHEEEAAAEEDGGRKGKGRGLDFGLGLEVELPITRFTRCCPGKARECFRASVTILRLRDFAFSSSAETLPLWLNGSHFKKSQVSHLLALCFLVSVDCWDPANISRLSSWVPKEGRDNLL